MSVVTNCLRNNLQTTGRALTANATTQIDARHSKTIPVGQVPIKRLSAKWVLVPKLIA